MGRKDVLREIAELMKTVDELRKLMQQSGNDVQFKAGYEHAFKQVSSWCERQLGVRKRIPDATKPRHDN